MAYLTENKLANVVDIPVALSTTELRQGDWLVIATVKLVQPMLLTVRYLSLELLSCNVDITRISTTNRIYSNLGLAYLTLRKDYLGGAPGASGALEQLVATDTGIYVRDYSTPLYITLPGNYSWLLVNNMQASSSSLVSPSISIDFKLCLTGQARLELSSV